MHIFPEYKVDMHAIIITKSCMTENRVLQTTTDFHVQYKRKARAKGFPVIDPAPRGYDVMWTLAIALNKTLAAIDNGGNISGTGCEEVPGSLVPLENFTYSNEKMGCLIQWNLQQTNFSGVSVGDQRSK